LEIKISAAYVGEKKGRNFAHVGRSEGKRFLRGGKKPFIRQHAAKKARKTAGAGISRGKLQAWRRETTQREEENMRPTMKENWETFTAKEYCQQKKQS